MNVYIPPQRREASSERLQTHGYVKDFLRQRGIEVVFRTGGARSLPWLAAADTMILETNAITAADEAECLYMAQQLGREVLVLFDTQNAQLGGQPSEALLAASRWGDGPRDPNSPLWFVRQRTISNMPNMVIDLALKAFTAHNFDIKEPLSDKAGTV